MQHLIPNNSLVWRVSSLLLALGLVGYIMYIGQDIIIPVLFSAFFAILLNPVVVFFTDRKVPRSMAIALTITIAITAFFGLAYFIISQVSVLAESLPALKERSGLLINQGVAWISDHFHIGTAGINRWLGQLESDLMADSRVYVGTTLSTLTGIAGTLILVPVYTIMMLYYESLFIVFVQKVVPEHKHKMVKEIITRSKSVMQSYLFGLLVEGILVAFLNSLGLFLLGIEYAILWGVIGALLNVIPYIGIIIATVFPFTMALVTKDVYHAFIVLAIYALIQFIDNNIIVPKIVASRVKINALISVVVVLIGGSMWGISGMFLSIPLVAVVKIVFDKVTTLRPYGYLLGDSMPEKAIFFKRNRKAV